MDTQDRAEYLRQLIEMALAVWRPLEEDVADGAWHVDWMDHVERECDAAMEALAVVAAGESSDPAEMDRHGGNVTELEVHLRVRSNLAGNKLRAAGKGMVKLAEEIA
jgi:hypothetical protein